MNKIGIIGMGRVGKVMAYLLANRNYRVKVTLSQTNAAAFLKIRDCQISVRKLEALAREVDVVLITTPDRVIGEIAAQLSEIKNISFKAALHMSGGLEADILKPLKAQGVTVGSLHPLQSIAQLDQALINLPGSTFTFEGDEELLPWVKALMNRLACHLLTAPAGLNKTLYHTGASMVSNFLVTLAQMGTECLTAAGLPAAEARQALIPLMQGTLANLQHLPAEQALTGPIVRGDVTTVKMHLQVLKQLQATQPQLLSTYLTLGGATTTLAVDGGFLPKEKAQDMLETIKMGGS